MIRNNYGVTIIEFIVSVALIAMFLPALLMVFISYYQQVPVQTQQLQAISYLKDEEEKLKVVDQNSFSNIIPSNVTLSNNSVTNYHINASGSGANSTWVLASGSETINSNFTRKIAFYSIYRSGITGAITNGPEALSSTPAVVDDTQTTKRSVKAVVTVSWTQPFATSVSDTMYLTRYLGNNSYMQTSGDFNANGSGGNCIDLSSNKISLSGNAGCNSTSTNAQRTYTSNSFDLGALSTINNLTWTSDASDMNNTASFFSFQLSVSDDNSTWIGPIGPDGTNGTYFTFTAAPSSTAGFSSIPLAAGGNQFIYHRYFKYTVLLDTSTNSSITSVNLNYTQ